MWSLPSDDLVLVAMARKRTRRKLAVRVWRAEGGHFQIGLGKLGTTCRTSEVIPRKATFSTTPFCSMSITSAYRFHPSSF